MSENNSSTTLVNSSEHFVLEEHHYCPPGFKLRDYQKEGIKKSLDFLLTGEANSVYNASQQRLGKTPMTVCTVNALGVLLHEQIRVLVVCPAIVRLTWKKEIEKWSTFQFNIKPVVAETGKRIKDFKFPSNTQSLQDWLIVSYQGAASYAKELAKLKPDVVIIDEAHNCLEENTLISTPKGKIPIKYLEIGDEVYSFSDNGLDIGRIIRKIKGDEEEPRRKIYLENGQTLEGLDWHLIRTPSGWTELGNLQISNSVSVVQEGVGCKIPFMALSSILQSEVCQIPSLSQRRMDRTYANPQSYAKESYTGQGVSNFKTYRPQTLNSWREWTKNTFSSIKIKKTLQTCISWSQNYFRAANKNEWTKTGVSDLLQTGSSYTESNDCFRSRRQQSQSSNKETTRFKEGQEITRTRVERIEIYEPTNIKNPDRSYWDLELDTNHNYIANETIVHNCKNTKAKRTKNILKIIWPECTYRIALSGTPFTRDLIDGWSVFSKMAPSVLGNFKEYAENFCYWDVESFKYHGSKNENILNKIIFKKFFIRYKTLEVLPDLPPRVYEEITLDKRYELAEFRDLFNSWPVPIQEKFLSEGTVDPRFAEHIATIRRLQGLMIVDPVVEFTKELLDQNLPVVLIGIHKEVIKQYVDKLSNYNPVLVIGGMSDSARQSSIENFQGGRTNLIIINMHAGGVGITLDRARDCVTGEMDWSPAILDQAWARIDSTGENKGPSNVNYFTIEDSIIQQIIHRAVEKIKIFKKVIG